MGSSPIKESDLIFGDLHFLLNSVLRKEDIGHVQIDFCQVVFLMELFQVLGD